MERIALKTNCALAFVIAGLLAAGQAFADKPSWAGGGKSEKGEHREKSESKNSRHRDSDERSQRKHFDDRQRTAAHDFYGEQFRRGHCPPGLAKKHNGCMPPGQARKWTVGRPLPRDVIFYDVPPALSAQFGQPPAGHRFVRVASDILMIALGNGTVMDSILNLGRM